MYKREAIEVSCHAEEQRSIPLNCFNDAILRVAQEDEMKNVIVSDSETIQPIYNQKQLQEKIGSLCETSCPPLAGGPKSMISRRGKINCHVEENGNLSLNNFVEDIPLTCTPKVRFSSLRTASSPARGEEFAVAHWKNSRKIAFTLAEVLITLGIIGIVAAMTIPSLISKYQKHVYYNQFLKAVSVLGNAEKLYINDYCGGDASNCHFGPWEDSGFFDNFSQYFKIIKKINLKNYEEVCSGYTKLPVSERLDGSERAGNACSLYWALDTEANYGFITTDGMMFNLFVYEGPAEGGFVDINGPDKGPNIVGRDIFHFIYQNGNRDRSQVMGVFWNTETYMKNYVYSSSSYSCADRYDSWNNSWTCGERLLRDGKMDY